MTTDEKRKALAGYDCDNWSADTRFEVALNGFEGYNAIPNAKVEQIYNDVFGSGAGK